MRYALHGNMCIESHAFTEGDRSKKEAFLGFQPPPLPDGHYSPCTPPPVCLPPEPASTNLISSAVLITGITTASFTSALEVNPSVTNFG